MTADEILAELKALGNEGTRKVLLRHGAGASCLGVRIGDMQPLRKRIGKDHALALALYETGVYDAMYLAGLVADDAAMTEGDLQRWAERASRPLAGSTVAWVAAGGPHGWSLARRWIDSPEELIAAAGWATLASLVSVRRNEDLDLGELGRLLERVHDTLPRSPDFVRYQMNGFVIAAGCYVPALTGQAKQVGAALGPLEVDMGDTACQVPYAPDYIAKVEARGTLGKKRKTAKC